MNLPNSYERSTKVNEVLTKWETNKYIETFDIQTFQEEVNDMKITQEEIKDFKDSLIIDHTLNF